MKRVDDSGRALNSAKLNSRVGFNFRWVWIISSVFFLPLGITFSVAVGQNQFGWNRKSSVSQDQVREELMESGRRSIAGGSSESNTASSILPEASPTPENKTNTDYTLKGYVYDRNRTLVPSLKVTFDNPASGFTLTRNVPGKFTVSVPHGSYDITMRDQDGHVGRYRNILVNSDTSIKFSFGNYLDAKVTPTVEPTVLPTATPSATPTVSPSVSPKPTTAPKPSVSPRKVVPDNSDDNTNLDVNTNSNIADNSNTNIEEPFVNRPRNLKINPRKADPPKTDNFFTRNSGKIALTILGVVLVGALAWLGLPFLATIPALLAGFLAGIGIFGKTKVVEDDVRCTLYSAPEVQAGSDLLVQVFAHLLEQADGLGEMARELDPDSKKQKSKALKRKIKRDSVLTFKLIVPGIELIEDEQDIVWQGEPDSVEFIVPVPADHGDGNRFGRVFVYQNGDQLGKIPFRIQIVGRQEQIAPQSAEPAVGGVMTQNESAFVSYSSRDKGEVYKFVQLMDVLHYKYHIDIFHIDAGERWEQKLYEFIDTDEVFILFWSEAASRSEWVLKEAKRAEARATQDKRNLPRIVIHHLDKRVPVPEWLEDIHVDRKWAEIIGNIETQQNGQASNLSD